MTVRDGSASFASRFESPGMRMSSDTPVVRQRSAAHGGRFYRRTLPGRAAFWLLAATFCLLFVAAAAPAPLYRVYQGEWRFSVTTLTAVFAVYALVLLVALLMFGSVSDYFGRRNTIAVGLAAYGMACGVFLAAGGVAALFVARALQGVAVGLATGALGAAMIELQREGSGLAAPVSTAANPLGPRARGARDQRPGPVRAGANASRLVVAVGSGSRRPRGGVGHPGVPSGALPNAPVVPSAPARST